MFCIVPSYPNKRALVAGQEKFDALNQDIKSGLVDGRYVAEKIYRAMIEAQGGNNQTPGKLLAEVGLLSEKCGMAVSLGIASDLSPVFLISKDPDYGNSVLKSAGLNVGGWNPTTH